MRITTPIGGRADRKPDRKGPTPARENRNLAGMPGKSDLDPKTTKAARVGRVGTRPAKGW